MKFEKYLSENNSINENIFQNILNKIKDKKSNVVFNTLKNSWLKISNLLRDKEKEVLNIINKNIGTKFQSFDQISKLTISESTLNEDWTHYWEMMKQEGWPTLSFFPALTAWVEIGKLLEPGMEVNWVKFGVYALFFILLVSGKFVKNFHQWKSKNPYEYWSERPDKAKKKGIDIEKLKKEYENKRL